MKTKILFIACFLFFVLAGSTFVSSQETKSEPVSKGTVTITCTPDLYDLLLKWSGEYNKSVPDAGISVSTSPKAEGTLGINTLNFISGADYSALLNKPEWNIIVGHDAVVPIISSSNPLIYIINEKGVSRDNLVTALNDPAKRNWNTLTGSGQNLPLNVYLPYNGHVAEVVSGFLGISADRINYITSADEKELIAAVEKDPNGIGFSRMISVFNESEQGMSGNILLLPIDKNNNGKLDYHEKIYANRADFLRGIWIGKFPFELCENIFVVASAKPDNDAQLDFLKYVLTQGQIYLNDYGYFDLVSSDRQNELKKLAATEESIASTVSYSKLRIALFVFIGVILAGVAASLLAAYIRGRRKGLSEARLVSSAVLDANSVKVMPGLYFDRSHTWSFMEQNGYVRVGVDDFLQHVTGPITCVKMKKSGEKINKGDVFLSIIQEGKRLNIKSPVSGTIKEHNDVLIMNSTLVNTSPFTDGWIYMIEPSNWIKEIQSLLMADRYKIWIKDELNRLKDFLNLSVKEHRLELATVAMQDGGPLTDNVLASFGPEVWDDFQTKYLDTAF
ncbi:MAG: hypothetical protein AB9842_00160 [Bacteroidales bacterium]